MKRPTAAQVMRHAIIRAEARRQRRWHMLATTATNVIYAAVIIAGVIAIAIQ